MKRKTLLSLFGIFLMGYLIVLAPATTYAMHIMEGFLSKGWCLFWFVVSAPFVIYSIRSLNKLFQERPEDKLLVALSGAFVFFLSALKIPSVTGSCSHPTGVGLGTVLFGPSIMPLLGAIVLLFQAILLAHGGLTTLGANVFSMAIVGPYAAYGIYKLCKNANMNQYVAVFLAASLGDLLTYVVTSFQLAFAFPDPTGGVMASAGKFMAIFAMTQVPIAVIEGIITALIYDRVVTYEGRRLGYEK